MCKMKHNIIFSGGLGNQMFQYALYYALKKSGFDVSINTSLYGFVKMHNGYEIPRVFGVEDVSICKEGLYLTWLRLLLHFKPKFLLTNDEFIWSPNVLTSPARYINGCWQSDRYFCKYCEEIQNIFEFRQITKKNKVLALTMQEEDSVSIHVRRGDYLGLDQYANICDEMYYRKSVKEIQRRISRPHFYIFSNDTDWCKTFAESLSINYSIITHNTGKESYQDMFLMTQCHHNILANSSFSWWGAYLNTHKDAIKIAPKGWDNTDTKEYNAIRVPESYIRL